MPETPRVPVGNSWKLARVNSYSTDTELLSVANFLPYNVVETVSCDSDYKVGGS